LSDVFALEDSIAQSVADNLLTRYISQLGRQYAFTQTLRSRLSEDKNIYTFKSAISLHTSLRLIKSSCISSAIFFIALTLKKTLHLHKIQNVYIYCKNGLNIGMVLFQPQYRHISTHSRFSCLQNSSQNIAFVVLILQCKRAWTHMSFYLLYLVKIGLHNDVLRGDLPSEVYVRLSWCLYFVPVQHSWPRLLEGTCLVIEMYYSTNNWWNIGRSGFYYSSNFFYKSPCNTIFQTSYFTI